MRRWARRLRDFGFGREDGVILAYDSLGVDAQHQTFGAEAIVSTDQPLMRHFNEQHDSIARRFQQMICQLVLPYRLAHLRILIGLDEMLIRLIQNEN